jgi:hypothetical protein
MPSIDRLWFRAILEIHSQFCYWTLAQLLVADLRQQRIHYDDEADSNGKIGCAVYSKEEAAIASWFRTWVSR